METIEEFLKLCHRRRHFKLSISVQSPFPDTAPTGTPLWRRVAASAQAESAGRLSASYFQALP